VRTISAELREAIRSKTCRFGVLADIDHPVRRERLWTGVGNITWAGQTWKGIGSLGNIAGVDYASDLSIGRVKLTLTGIGTDPAATLANGVRGRRATVYWAAFREDGTVVPDPITIAILELDQHGAEIGEDGSWTYTIEAVSGVWQLERPTRRALTDAEQRRSFPTDNGFARIPQQTKSTFNWTRT